MPVLNEVRGHKLVIENQHREMKLSFFIKRYLVIDIAFRQVIELLSNLDSLVPHIVVNTQFLILFFGLNGGDFIDDLYFLFYSELESFLDFFELLRLWAFL